MPIIATMGGILSLYSLISFLIYVAFSNGYDFGWKEALISTAMLFFIFGGLIGGVVSIVWGVWQVWHWN